MHLTMKDVVKLQVMNKVEIHAGGEFLEDTIVEWVSVIETPVENFVRKHELVLSTGIGCQQEEVFLQFVKEVIESKASGLTIATGRHIDHLPDSIVDLANESRFPIMTIPWDVRFADIIQGILQALEKKKERLIEKNEEIQQQLLNIILNNGGLLEIANYIYKTIRKPVIITDKRGLIKEKSHNAQRLVQDWKEYLQSEDYAISLTPFEKTNYATSPNTRVINVNKRTLLQFMIQSTSEVQGYLIVEGLSQSELQTLLGQRTVHMLEHAVTAVALCFLKENTIRQTEMKLRDDFVWSLAKEKIRSWDSVLSRAKSLNYPIHLPFVCIIGFPENLRDIYKRSVDESSYEHWRQNVTRRIEDEIFYTGKMLDCYTLMTYQRGQFITFLEIKDGKGMETAFQFLDDLKDRINQLLPGFILSWGIGKTAGQYCFHESYQEAQKALEIGRRQKGPGHQNTYADTRVDRALMSLRDNEELKEIAEQTIGALLQYDQERGINLVNTFITYSRNRGNVSQTARHLNLHRQSLLYRLKKIESLTDCSLENQDEVFLIDLSIRLWTMGALERENGQ
ncbi:PucR family transcriptional regulator [Salirhabdus salicampi]|uniref:PucR family transcriptional regulator n=1 Tax=Salirhabdus salicampi TaxID=476102 RepID=UPI0020C45CD4|nr:PucR family transcriptional regulator [Salirhabdus salicampi]MCP8617709.1 PucR family transcriptional regulator ligand-binding domain-containing protein [Salirhabdus salicampi]